MLLMVLRLALEYGHDERWSLWSILHQFMQLCTDASW